MIDFKPVSPLPTRRSQGGLLGPTSKMDGGQSYYNVDRTETSSEPSGTAAASLSSTLVRDEVAAAGPVGATPRTGTAARTSDELVTLVMNHKSVIDKLRERDKKISNFMRRSEKEEAKIRSSLLQKEEKILKSGSKSSSRVTTVVFSKILPDR